MANRLLNRFPSPTWVRLIGEVRQADLHSSVPRFFRLWFVHFERPGPVNIWRHRCFASLILSAQLFSAGAAAQPCPGHRENFGNAKIVGGTEAKSEDWPTFAALRLKDPASTRVLYFCGGTVIGPTWILTAAHCTEGIGRAQDGTYVYTGSLKDWRVEIVLGAVDLENVAATHVRSADNVVIREGYTDPSISGNDLALFHLAAPWKGPVVRLALSAASEPADSMSFAAGFGALKSGQGPGWRKAKNGEMISAASAKLREVMLPIVKTDTCQAAYQAKPLYKNAKIGPAEICAGYDRGRKDTCQDDSGGPLVFYGRDNCPTQIGIVSWGDGCAAAKSYGVYARVSAHRDWILKHVPEAVQAPAFLASGQAVRGIADRQIATAVQQLEGELASAKGRVRIGVANGNRVKLGGLFAFKVDSDVSGRLIVIDVRADGQVTQVFPNRYVTSGEARFVSRGEALLIPDAANPRYVGLRGFRAVQPIGRGRLIAIVVPKHLQVADIIEAPERVSKGFAAEGAPASYILNLFDELIAATVAGTNPGDWALGEASYEIVTR